MPSTVQAPCCQGGNGGGPEPATTWGRRVQPTGCVAKTRLIPGRWVRGSGSPRPVWMRASQRVTFMSIRYAQDVRSQMVPGNGPDVRFFVLPARLSVPCLESPLRKE